MGYYWLYLIWLNQAPAEPPQLQREPTGEQLSLRRGDNVTLTRPDP